MFLRDLEFRMADLHHTNMLLQANNANPVADSATSDEEDRQISPTVCRSRVGVI